jgi:rod shape-determining protein MreD
MSAGRAALVVLAALVLQVCLLARFSYDGARTDVLILVVIAVGFLAGPERGAQMGFAAGLSFDVVLSTPLGLSALVYTVVGFAVGTMSRSVVRSAWWIGPVVVAAASAATMVLYALVAQLLGQSGFDGPPIGAVVAVVTVVNLILAPLALRAVRWTQVGSIGPARPFAAR